MLSILSVDDGTKWDAIVKSFKNYDIHYLSGYCTALQIHGDGEPLLFYFNNGSTRAINVVMKRDIAKDEKLSGKVPEGKYFDLSTPYGYGGWIIDGDDVNTLDKEYSTYCCENNIISEFVRFNPILSNYDECKDFYEVDYVGPTVTIDTSSEEIIWSNITSKCRNTVRKAQKNNVKIYQGKDDWVVDKFISMYNQTMSRDNAKEYYFFGKDFYLGLLNGLGEDITFFYAKKDDEVIAMSIILFSGNIANYYLSASKKEYQHFAPTNLLLYEVACWASRNHYKYFNLGGGLGGKEDRLYDFKKSFNRNSETKFYVGRKVFDRAKYNQLVEIRKSDARFDERADYFPLYSG